MGSFKNNPAQPYEVKIPNKIRKRIALHYGDAEKDRTSFGKSPAIFRQGVLMTQGKKIFRDAVTFFKNKIGRLGFFVGRGKNKRGGMIKGGLV